MNEPKKLPYIPGKPDAEVDSELRFHLERRIEANLAAGMSPEEARQAAIARFGDVEGVREECERLLTMERKTRRRRDWLDDLRQDLRFSVRSALGSPMFTMLAVLTLALGIGANAAMFGVVKSVLLNSLPYEDAGRLTRIYTPIKALGERIGSISAGTISDLRERQHSFSSLGASPSLSASSARFCSATKGRNSLCTPLLSIFSSSARASSLSSSGMSTSSPPAPHVENSSWKFTSKLSAEY